MMPNYLPRTATDNERIDLSLGALQANAAVHQGNKGNYATFIRFHALVRIWMGKLRPRARTSG